MINYDSFYRLFIRARIGKLTMRGKKVCRFFVLLVRKMGVGALNKFHAPKGRARGLIADLR